MALWRNILLGKKGFSLVEALVAAGVLATVGGLVASTVISNSAPNKNRRSQNENCSAMLKKYMKRITKSGLSEGSLELVSTTNPILDLQLGERLQRSLSAGESEFGISNAHRIPGGEDYDLVDKRAGSARPALRNALLMKGAMSTLQSIYNSNAGFCENVNGLPYSSTGVALLPQQELSQEWRGKLVGDNQKINVSLGLRIQTYQISTGLVETSCPDIPLILQPRAAAQPPAAYNDSLNMAQRGSGVDSDRGFLITLKANYIDPDNQARSCTLTQKVQHPSKTSPPNAPSAQIGAVDDNAPICTDTFPPPATTFAATLRYTKNRASAGSVILCRDRSVRLRPIRMNPASETDLRGGPYPSQQEIERCRDRNGAIGGLAAGAVNNCFVRRRDLSVAGAPSSPWNGEVAVSDANDWFYMPPSTISGLEPVNEWVPCEDIAICQIGTTASPSVTTNIRATTSEIIYELNFNLGKDQAGCFVHIDIASVDPAGNYTLGTPFSRAFMADGSPQNTSAPHGYCVGPGVGLSTPYASCYEHPGVSNFGDGDCPCAIDRHWDGNDCVPAPVGSFSRDDDARLESCNNKPPHSHYTSSGGTDLLCEWACDSPGYTLNATATGCDAVTTPVDGICGATNNSCTAGNHDDLTDSPTQYLWRCLGENGGVDANCSAAKPASGACGGSNNSCLSGTLDDIPDTSSHYLWNCLGPGGNASCSLTKSYNGACGSSLNTCTSGDFENTTDSGTHYRWNCLGGGGGTNSNCSLHKPVNGSCGSNLNQCVTGTLNNIGDTATHYRWNCLGQYNGTNANCSLPIPFDPSADCPNEHGGGIFSHWTQEHELGSDGLWYCKYEETQSDYGDCEEIEFQVTGLQNSFKCEYEKRSKCQGSSAKYSGDPTCGVP